MCTLFLNSSLDAFVHEYITARMPDMRAQVVFACGLTEEAGAKPPCIFYDIATG